MDSQEKKTSRTRKTLIGIIGGVLAVGAISVGIALAADSPATPTPAGNQQSHITRLAKNLGIDEKKLTDAMTQTHNDMLDEAVRDGRLTKEQADLMKQNMQNGGCDEAGGMMSGSAMPSDMASQMNGLSGMMGGMSGNHAQHHGGTSPVPAKPAN